MPKPDETHGITEIHGDGSRSTIVKAYFRDVVKSTVIVAGRDVHYTTIVQGQEITLPTPEELAAYRNAVADYYAKWDDPRYIQEEGEFLPLFASPYDEIEGPSRERTDLLDAIRSAQRIIVLGEPGMGKTTALERLMLEYARQGEGPLPVFVPLLYYTGDLMESIRTELNRHAAFHLPDEAHTRAFLQGVPCVLMFDGLNEVSGRLREKIAGEIRQVMGDYPRQRYAVTSRSQDELWQSLRGEDEDLPTVVIREIGDEQVRDYLCGHLGAEAGQALYDRLDERMRGLAHNPLLLWMIKEARTDEAGALPDNRGRLFDHFVTQMLKREVRLKEWAVSIPARVKRECLAELAYEMFTSERESRLFVASPQAEAVLAVYLEGRPGARYEVRQVLEESKRNGLLTGEENVRFMHQSVQEFFAALVLKSKVRMDATRTGLGRFKTCISNTVISRLLIAAGAPWASDPFWGTLRSPTSVLWLLSGGAVSVAIIVVVWRAAGLIEDKMRFLETLKLLYCFLGIGYLLLFLLYPPVFELVSDRSPSVRRVARWLLSSFAGSWLVHATDDWWVETFVLLVGMADDPSWLVREVARVNVWLAYWCLLEQQEIDEETRLVVEQATTEALASPRRAVRLRAVQALSGMANPRTVEPLVTALGDEDEGVARVAQRGLVRMGEGAVEGLVTALGGPEQRVRTRAGGALNAIGDFRVDREWCGLLITSLGDEDEGVARVAQRALVRMGEGAVEGLVTALANPIQRVRSRAASTLDTIGDFRVDERWGGLLITALGEEDENVARVAQQALVRIGEGAVEPLVTALGDEDEAIASVAQHALGRMGEPAVGSLEILTEDRRASLLTHIRAGHVLVRIGERRANVSPLIAVISDPEAPVAERLRAGNELGRIGDPRFYGPYLEPELITVPGGEFWMGSETEAAYSGEQPAHRIQVPEFQVAKYPVTNAQFGRFVDAGGYNQEGYWIKAGWAWRREKPGERRWPRGWGDGRFPPERANHPVVKVTWYEAQAYTRWLAEVTDKPYRLPTEAEWEKAARGDQDRREYPWGDEFDHKRINMRIGDEQVGGTSPVGIYPDGASPYGIMDLSGNVLEWCSSFYWDYPYDPDDGREDLEAEGRRVWRGGSWLPDDERYARCSSRLGVTPSFFGSDLGFRLVVGFAHSRRS